MADRILRQLRSMKRSELALMAGEFEPPIEVKKTWNSNKIALEIRKRQQAMELVSGKAAEPDAAQITKPSNSAFEDALAVEPAAELPKENRGGVRPGAGRPAGMTADKAKVKNLAQQPNQAIKMFFEMLFNLWSEKTKVKELALSEEESNLIALPVTQLQEYYYGDTIPEIAFVWLAAAGGVSKVMYTKLLIIREVNNGSKSKTGNGQEGIGQNSESKEPGQPGKQDNNI